MFKTSLLGLSVAVGVSSIAGAQSFPFPTVVVDSGQLSPSTETQTIALEVWTDGLGGPPIDLAHYQFVVSTVGPNELVKILSIGAPTVHPYVFDPTSTMPSGIVAGDSLSAEIGDTLDPLTGLLNDGDGFVQLTMEVLPGARGDYHVLVSQDPAQSFLAQSSTEFIEFNVEAGLVRVVPEPSSLCLALLLAVACSLRMRIRTCGW